MALNVTIPINLYLNHSIGRIKYTHLESLERTFSDDDPNALFCPGISLAYSKRVSENRSNMCICMYMYYSVDIDITLRAVTKDMDFTKIVHNTIRMRVIHHKILFLEY